MSELQFVPGNRIASGGAQVSPGTSAYDGYTITTVPNVSGVANVTAKSGVIEAIAVKTAWTMLPAAYFPNSGHHGCRAGQVLYAPAVGFQSGIEKAISSALATTMIAGIAQQDFFDTPPIDESFIGVEVLNGGMLALTTDKWAAVIDEGGALVPNTYYYVSAATPGNITSVKPMSPNYVMRVGYAVSPGVLSIQIGEPVVGGGGG